ncbi:hypothetical protein ACLKA7_013028 [Drosophila subpalustris]
MSALINRLSDGCVDFEKCGDVVVSPKDNMIGVFCHFCCDIFRSLLEFLHHLQDAHNDVLWFPRPHNVYTVEQLLSLPDRSSPVQSGDAQMQANCSSSCDSGIPADAIPVSGVDSVFASNENIMNAFAEWGIDLKLIEQQPAGQEEQLIQIKDKNNFVSKTTEPPINFTEKTITTTRAKRSSRIQEAGNRKQPLCNPKSYAIARSARKREQQQRLSILKRRIIRSLQNDEVKSIRKPFREQQINDLQKLLPNNQHKITKLTPSKIEYLPKLTLNLDKSQSIKLSSLEHTLKRNNEAVQMEKPANEMLKQPRRRSSISGISSPAMVAKKPARRPSYSDPNSRQTQMKSVKPELKRKQLTMNISETVKEKRTKPEDSSQIFPSFDLSESVVEFLQTDLKSSQLDADSLLQLAEPKMERNSDTFDSVINQVERKRVTLDENLMKMTEDLHKIEANSTVRAKVRDDLTLLQLVGLPIIKDPNIEDRQPVEYSEELRSKAAKFGQMLKEHNTVWNPQRYNGPVTPALIMKPFNLMEGSQATFTYSCMLCRAHSHWDHQPQLICIHYRRVYAGHGANVWAPEGNQPLD